VWRIIAVTSLGAVVVLAGFSDAASAACSADAQDRTASPAGIATGAAGQSVWVNPSLSGGEAGGSTAIASGEAGGSVSGLGGSAYFIGDSALTTSYAEGSGSANASTLSGSAGGDGYSEPGNLSASGHGAASPTPSFNDVQVGALCLTP
jgi:hypothetical protein